MIIIGMKSSRRNKKLDNDALNRHMSGANLVWYLNKFMKRNNINKESDKVSDLLDWLCLNGFTAVWCTRFTRHSAKLNMILNCVSSIYKTRPNRKRLRLVTLFRCLVILSFLYDKIISLSWYKQTLTLSITLEVVFLCFCKLYSKPLLRVWINILGLMFVFVIIISHFTKNGNGKMQPIKNSW